MRISDKDSYFSGYSYGLWGGRLEVVYSQFPTLHASKPKTNVILSIILEEGVMHCDASSCVVLCFALEAVTYKANYPTMSPRDSGHINCTFTELSKALERSQYNSSFLTSILS